MKSDDDSKICIKPKKCPLRLTYLQDMLLECKPLQKNRRGAYTELGRIYLDTVNIEYLHMGPPPKKKTTSPCCHDQG